MIWRVSWLAGARADLLELFDWIADRADVDTGEAYTTRIESRADKLISNPFIGTPRDDIEAGLRSIVYRRRTIIFYRIASEDVIEIVRISHGGRDLGAMFPRDE